MHVLSNVMFAFTMKKRKRGKGIRNTNDRTKTCICIIHYTNIEQQQRTTAINQPKKNIHRIWVRKQKNEERKKTIKLSSILKFVVFVRLFGLLASSFGTNSLSGTVEKLTYCTYWSLNWAIIESSGLFPQKVLTFVIWLFKSVTFKSKSPKTRTFRTQNPPYVADWFH